LDLTGLVQGLEEAEREPVGLVRGAALLAFLDVAG
jgi:hypothetical protein